MAPRSCSCCGCCGCCALSSLTESHVDALEIRDIFAHHVLDALGLGLLKGSVQPRKHARTPSRSREKRADEAAESSPGDNHDPASCRASWRYDCPLACVSDLPLNELTHSLNAACPTVWNIFCDCLMSSSAITACTAAESSCVRPSISPDNDHSKQTSPDNASISQSRQARAEEAQRTTLSPTPRPAAHPEVRHVLCETIDMAAVFVLVVGGGAIRGASVQKVLCD